MSLVIAVKDKNRIVLGADKQVSTGYSKDHTCTKIWEVPNLSGAIMGGVGSARASQIVQYTPIVDKNDLDTTSGVTTEWVILSLVPCIVSALKNGGIDCSVQEESHCTIMPNAFLFAYKDKAWMIWNDLSVTEVVDYLAIGSGSDVANGALYATPDNDPFDRIVTAIDAAAESTLYVDNGVDLLMTEQESSDAKNIAKALGCNLDDIKAAVAQLVDGSVEIDGEIGASSKNKKEKTTKKSKSKKNKE